HRRRPRARRGQPRGTSCRGRDRADRDRVRAAALPDAQPQAGAVEGPDPRPRVERRLRRPGQRRRALHLLPAQEDRRGPRPDDPHDARRGIRAEAVNRFASLTSRLVVTTVLLVAVVAILIAGAATIALRSYLS